MFKIELTDPHTMDKQALFKIAKFIFELSGHQIAEESPTYEIGINLQNQTVEARPESNASSMQDREAGLDENGKPYDEYEMNYDQPITITGVDDTTTEEDQLVPDEDLERDASGNLWDKKIHSRTRSKDAKGNWKFQRGLDKSNIEVKQTPPPPPAPLAAAVPPPPPLSSSDPVVPERNFNSFVMTVTKAIADGKLHTTKMIEILNRHGVADLPELPRVPGALEKVWNEIMEAIKP